MLMGAVCTRACRFCSVDTGNPRGWLDAEEPENTARSVELMKLKYIVLTSVNRDDLPDGGAEHYAAAIRAIKRRTPQVAVEALTPDFQGVLRDVETVVDSGLEVFAQNVETVKRLTHPVRDPRAGYEQTIAVLAHAKKHRARGADQDQPDAGARRNRRGNRRDHGRSARGQRGSADARPVPAARPCITSKCSVSSRRRSSTSTAKWALAKGFRECVAGPLVRSSYRAEQALAGNNAGIMGNGDTPHLLAERRPFRT